MKKTLGILMALILAATMLFSLASCGTTAGDDTADTEKSDKELTPEELIVGEWEYTTAFGDYMSEMLSASLGDDSDDYFGNLKFDMTFDFEFTKDGEAKLTIDESKFEKSLDAMKDDIRAGLEKMIRDMAEENDADLDELVSQSGYDSLDDLIDEALSELSTEAMLEGFGGSEILSGSYEFDGDKLYILDDGEEKSDDNYMNFEISEKKLKLDLPGDLSEDFGDDADIAEIIFPMECTRK